MLAQPAMNEPEMFWGGCNPLNPHLDLPLKASARGRRARGCSQTRPSAYQLEANKKSGEVDQHLEDHGME